MAQQQHQTDQVEYTHEHPGHTQELEQEMAQLQALVLAPRINGDGPGVIVKKSASSKRSKDTYLHAYNILYTNMLHVHILWSTQ